MPREVFGNWPSLQKFLLNTVSRFEHSEELTPATVASIATALESAGVEFIKENLGGPGARVRK